MTAKEKAFLDLHLVYRDEIRPTEDVTIDETVFEEIYRLQEEEHERVSSRIHEHDNSQITNCF